MVQQFRKKIFLQPTEYGLFKELIHEHKYGIQIVGQGEDKAKQMLWVTIQYTAESCVFQLGFDFCFKCILSEPAKQLEASCAG